MSRLHITVLSLVLLVTCSISASDWPAYRHDARRSATSVDRLEFPLRLSWHRRSTLAPRPAFNDPLKHPSGIDFAYVRDYSEPVLLDFDHAYHPIAAKGRVYFGSSADDSIRCLSLANGKEQWAFVTGGPVRFAPQVVGNRLYVASDDGFVYCLESTNGDLIWKFRAAPSARQLSGNQRMISRWPLRTGILVQDNTVYTTAGMWPAEGIFVYALDAQTGTVKWINNTSGTLNQPTASRGAYAITGIAPTGYLLANPETLVVPTGRSIPASYSLRDGRLLASVAPSYQNRRGGPAVCIDSHGSVIFGYPRERLTGKDYSVHYVHRLPNLTQFGTIRADRFVCDDRAFVATNDRIRCYEANSRYTKVKVIWQHDCPSRNLRCLALSANALLLGSDNQVTARDRKTGDILWHQGRLDGYVQSVAVADEKLLVATDAGSIYCFRTASDSRATDEETAPLIPVDPGSRPAETGDLTLRKLLKEEGNRRGFALVLGHSDTTVASQIAVETQLQVVLLLDDNDATIEARNGLLKTRQPTGGRVSVQVHDRNKPLPFADYAFNLIIATSDVTVDRTEEMHRVLRPAGGVLFVDQATAEVKQVLSSFAPHKGPNSSSTAVGSGRLTTRDDASLTYCRGKLAGALDWNSETKTDQRVKWPLELLWFGGPGSKRTGQGSRPPIAAGGRNLVIGKNHLMALDAYNGTELWARTLPYLYRNIGRLRNAPGPINPWLTQSVSADDDHVYLNLGQMVYTLDANSGQQQAVHGKFATATPFVLEEEPLFSLRHFQKPGARGVSSTTTRSANPAGSIQLREDPLNATLQLTLQLADDVEITDKVYWELFFDVRQPQQRVNLFEKGVFHLLVRPSTGSVETGIGAVHPNVTVLTQKNGRRMRVTFQMDELAKIGNRSLNDFCFAAALNHPPRDEQQTMAVGRAYLRWEVHCDSLAYAVNNGWAQIVRNKNLVAGSVALPPKSELPAHALRAARLGGVQNRNASLIGSGQERENPLSLEMGVLQYARGKGCGNPISTGNLHVMRSGTLAFYDLDEDSGMHYFGGVRPSCTISAVPAQGLVFAVEGSSSCSCNYNFKTTLALAPAKKRRHEDWAMFTASLSPGALLRSGRLNLAAPGDRRDDNGELWLQYPRAPTYSKQTIPVPVQLLGKLLRPYRLNADHLPIANTDRPWLYASGFEGLGGLRLQLYMSDQEGIAVFPSKPPKLDAVLTENGWDRRYAVTAGKGSSMFLSHDNNALYLGYEIELPVDRRGQRRRWTKKGTLPYFAQFHQDQPADDTSVWEEDSIEFLISDTSLKTILHCGVGITGGRYDGRWTTIAKKEDPAYSGTWSGTVRVTPDKAAAEFSFPWKTLTAAGLDLDNLVIRPRSKQPITRQPHISHGFRPILLQGQPTAKRYRVALHFAELRQVAAGECVFDIQIQGQTVLKDFDPVAAAGGVNRAVIREFAEIQADRALDIRFISRANPTTKPPILSAVEVMLDD